MKKFVRVVAALMSAISGILIILMAVFLILGMFDWVSFVVSAVVLITSSMLSWALFVALDKVERLEEKVRDMSRDIRRHEDVVAQKKPKQQETAEAPYICKVCGHKLAPEDRLCPRCMTPCGESNNVTTEDVSNGEYVCKVCGNTLAPDEDFCPRCMAPRGKSNKK